MRISRLFSFRVRLAGGRKRSDRRQGQAGERERAREILLLTEGSMALTLNQGGRSYIDAAARAAKQLIGQK